MTKQSAQLFHYIFISIFKLLKIDGICHNSRPKCWKICDIRYCRLSAPTDGFGIAEFSVKDARSGLEILTK